MKNQTMNQCD